MTTSGPGGEALPIVEAVWEQRRGWETTARAGKAAQDRGRAWMLCLGSLGAVLGAAAAQVESLELGVAWLPKGLGVASGVAVAVAGWIGRQFFSESQDSVWARARILAEALQRDVLLCVMRAPPYDGDGAGEILETRAREYRTNLRLDQVARGEPADVGPIPGAGIDDYVEHRVADQIGWYRRRKGQYERRARSLKRVSLGLGLAAVVLGALGSVHEAIPVWVPAVTTVSGALLTFMQASKMRELVPLYERTADQLEFRLAHYRSGKLSDVQLVEQCEAIMAQENSAWQAEWTDAGSPAPAS